jgi:hypothetical protein
VVTTSHTRWRQPFAFRAALRWILLATPLHVAATVLVLHGDVPAPGVVAAVVLSGLAVLPYAPLRQVCRADPELRYLSREIDVVATAGLLAPRVWEWLLDPRWLPLLALTLLVDALVVWRLEFMRRRIGRPWTTWPQSVGRSLRRRQRAVRRVTRRFAALTIRRSGPAGDSRPGRGSVPRRPARR